MTISLVHWMRASPVHPFDWQSVVGFYFEVGSDLEEHSVGNISVHRPPNEGFFLDKDHRISD